MSFRSEEFKSMKWQEFKSLLAGLGEDTPLARTVSIRLENDPDKLKYFTSSQLRIRSEWQNKKAKPITGDDIERIKSMFKNL